MDKIFEDMHRELIQKLEEAVQAEDWDRVESLNEQIAQIQARLNPNVQGPYG